MTYGAGRNKQWHWTCPNAKCGTTTCWTSTDKCYKCGAARKGRKPKPSSPAAAGEPTVAQQLSALRAQLAEAKKHGAQEGMAEMYKGPIEGLTAKIDALQAQKDAEVPPCYSEVSVLRKQKTEERKRDALTEEIAQIEKQREELETKLKNKREALEIAKQKIEEYKAKSEELRKPPVGVGWGVVDEHLKRIAEAIKDEVPKAAEDPHLKAILESLQAVQAYALKAQQAPAPDSTANAKRARDQEAGSAEIQGKANEESIKAALEGAGWNETEITQNMAELVRKALALDDDNLFVVKKPRRQGP